MKQSMSANQPVSDALFWQAVVDRDPSFDGIIYTGVLTTGIYCKPSCPARRPKPSNVRFFTSPESARNAGLRACLRCKPEDIGDGAGPLGKVRTMCKQITSEDKQAPTFKVIAQEAGLSEGHAQKLFKSTLGVTPKQFSNALRLNRFRAVAGTGISVTSAVYEAGYGSSSRFYENDASKLGMSPRTYTRKGAGLTIFHTVEKTALGPLLLAGTPQGLCVVRFGDSKAAVEKDLKDEFANADFKEGPTGFPAPLNAWRKALLAYLSEKTDWPLLPLDIVGTAFQAKVWTALRRIPNGQTATYSEIAQAIGAPKAVRAVASACAKNPVALAIPCHRVVPKSGGPGDYRWGAARKKKLLKREQEG